MIGVVQKGSLMSKLQRRVFLNSTTALATGLMLNRNGHAQNEDQPIRVGQIGTGHAHASGKMATLRKLSDDFQVVGVVEHDPQRREAAKERREYSGLAWMSTDQLLATPGLQAVAIETTVPDLVRVAGQCIAAGKHIHLDKPAGLSLAAFRDVLQQADSAGLAVQMGYMFRNNPAFQFCFEAVKNGWLGQIFEIHAVISKRVGDQQRDRLRQIPGGAMFELGCHLIDALVAVMGQPQNVTPYIRATRSRRDDLQDNMLAVFEYPQATCTVRSSLVEVEGQRRRQFVVCGTSGTVEIVPLEPPQLRLTLDAPHDNFRRGQQDVSLPPMPGRYDDQLKELAAVIRGEIENPYPSKHDLIVHDTVLRASGLPLDVEIRRKPGR
jgi:predicted dehydrogenase